MTVGQRIAQKRKELGLSQEGLGERLGVSRQTVYKWESDAALPEIEKLVKLGREFSVSIDWLLGREDEPRELTPEQLRVVEEIVGRYLAARPPEERAEGEPTPRRRWPWALAALALLAVFVSLFIRLDRVNAQCQYLSSSLNYIQQDIGNQINGITGRMEDILQSQNALTAEQSAEVASVDYPANTVTVSARALPRTYVEGMTAEFILASGRETVTVPGAPGDGNAFTAQLTGPLSDDITVSVAFLTGDRRETQQLGQFTGLYKNSWPGVMISSWGYSHRAQEGRWVINGLGSVTLYDRPLKRKETSIRLGVFRDGQLLAWYTEEPEQPTHVDEYSDKYTFLLEEEVTMETGAAYCLAAVLTDEYGHEWVKLGDTVTLRENGEVDRDAPDLEPSELIY